MQSEAATVAEYLESLAPDRRVAVERVRDTVLDNIGPGFEEVMNWGMITYQVPIAVHGDTYNGRPLMYAALASHKRHMSLYLTAVYADEQRAAAFHEAYRATGKPLDMGKSCVRFKQLDDLPLSLIGETIGAMDVGGFIALVERHRR